MLSIQNCLHPEDNQTEETEHMTVTTEVIGDRQVEVHQVEIEPVRVRVLPDDSLDSNNAAKYLDRKPKTLAMWRIIHAHANECWDHTPRLNVRAPEKQCGKTTLLDVLMPLVPRAMKTENVSTAVVFRAAAAYKPTLLVDECDTQLCGKDADKELVSILNAGHGRSGRAFRCEGDDNRIKGFPVFGPAVLAGIGLLRPSVARGQNTWRSWLRKSRAGCRTILMIWRAASQTCRLESSIALRMYGARSLGSRTRPAAHGLSVRGKPPSR
jgi:hypothetical protein